MLAGVTSAGSVDGPGRCKVALFACLVPQMGWLECPVSRILRGKISVTQEYSIQPRVCVYGHQADIPKHTRI